MDNCSPVGLVKEKNMFDEPKDIDQDTKKIDKIINIIIGDNLYHIDVEYSAQCPLAIKTGNFRNHIMCGLAKSSYGHFEFLCNPSECPLDNDKKKSFNVDMEDNYCLEFFLGMLKDKGWKINEKDTVVGEWGTRKTLEKSGSTVSFSFFTDYEFAIKLMYFNIGLNNAAPMCNQIGIKK
jgi:hypothetical protein